jgi:hypothetical protein
MLSEIEMTVTNSNCCVRFWKEVVLVCLKVVLWLSLGKMMIMGKSRLQ